VLDASRAVGVASQLLSAEQRDGFISDVRDEYRNLRESRAGRTSQKRLATLADARANGLAVDWPAYRAVTPHKPGLTVFDNIDLAEVRRFIDWTPFFTTWELHGRYPAILDDAVVGESARQLFADAQALLDCIIDEKWLQAKAVVGLYPANSVGDDLLLFEPGVNGRQPEAAFSTIHSLRQQMERPPGRPNLALSDFVAPLASGVEDYMGLFAVTAGIGLDEVVRRFDAANDDYNRILSQALADRLAEALAEMIHGRVRRELWGYVPNEALDNEALIAEHYQGVRPAPGYPACPDHTEKGEIFRVLDAPHTAEMTLTESFAMMPAAAVSGYYFAHPQSQYFGLGRIDRDQVEDYARRKGWDIETAERWLAPVLSYR
jgi:5-methyltetrahydrofolate--homocysteine methyltransferase